MGFICILRQGDTLYRYPLEIVQMCQNNEKNEVALVGQPFLLYLCTLFEAFSNGFLLFRPLFNVNPKNYES